MNTSKRAVACRAAEDAADVQRARRAKAEGGPRITLAAYKRTRPVPLRWKTVQSHAHELLGICRTLAEVDKKVRAFLAEWKRRPPAASCSCPAIGAWKGTAAADTPDAEAAEPGTAKAPPAPPPAPPSSATTTARHEINISAKVECGPLGPLWEEWKRRNPPPDSPRKD